MMGANDPQWFGIVEPIPGLRGMALRALNGLLVFRALRHFYLELASPEYSSRVAGAATRGWQASWRLGPGEKGAFSPHFIAGRDAFDKKDYPTAEAELMKATREAPWFLEARLELAHVYLVTRRLKRGQDLLESTGMENLPAALEQLALIHSKQGDAEGAIRSLEQVVDIEGGLDEATRITTLEAYRQERPGTAIASVSAANYLELLDYLNPRGIRLAAMQYPTMDPKPLQTLFPRDSGVTVIDNVDNFSAALANGKRDDYFRDRFGSRLGGDWGHCTAAGDRLIAERVADRLSEAGLLPPHSSGASSR
jgi:hypothetical protein